MTNGPTTVRYRMSIAKPFDKRVISLLFHDGRISFQFTLRLVVGLVAH
jgi:hypothetical protein